MPGKWATEAAIAKAKEWLAEEYPGQTIEILDTFDVAWPGWAGDNQGAIVRRGDEIDLVIVDGSHVTSQKPLIEQLADQVVDYHRLAAGLASVVQAYTRLSAGASSPPADASQYEESSLAVFEGNWAAPHHVAPFDPLNPRQPGESDADFALRQVLVGQTSG